jgi:murein DD-endopeptidase MepM/ murein hydrolase activator NlpD
MAHVSDLIAGAANASAIDVNQFKFSLQAAGAVAATVGFNFDDLATGIAVMGKAGIAGSDAGTSLKTMLLNLQPSTKAQVAEFQRLGLAGFDNVGIFNALAPAIEENAKANAVWEKHVKAGTDTLENMHKVAQDFGIVQDDVDFNKWAFDAGFMGNAFFDATGKVKPMAEVAEQLQEAMKDLTEQERLASLEIMFGSDAIRAAAILAKEGAEGFNEMADAMGQVAATDVAAARLDNLNGSMEQMKGSMETVGITIGKILIPATRMLVDGVTGILNAFLGLSPQVQTFITYAAVAGAAIGAVATVALTLVAILPTLVAGFAAVSTIAGVVGAVLTGPLLLAILGIGAAVVGLKLAWDTNFLGIQDLVGNFWAFVSPIFGMVAEALTSFARVVIPEATAAWTSLTTVAQALWQGFIDYFTPVFADFKKTWDVAWPAIQTVATGAFTIIDSVIRVLWELLKGFILTTLKILQGDWEGAWNTMRDAVKEAWKVIDDRIRDFLPKLATFIGEKWDEVTKKNAEIWDPETGTVPSALRNAWNGIQTAIGTALGNILERLGTFANEAFEKAKEIGAKIIDGIKQAISDAAGSVGDALKGVVENAIRGAQEKLNSWKPSLPSIPMPTFGRGGPGEGANAPLPPVEDAGAWVSPMRGAVTQEFGKTPYSHVYPGGIHTGIDVAASGAAAIVAARSGRVDIAGWDTSGYGNLVAITHPGGFRTLYAHLSEIAVRPGQNVLSGQLIGRQGSTGNSTGPHLHFEVRESGKATNPRRYAGFATGGVVPGPIGSGTPIMAHGGEVILRPDQAQAMGLGIMRGIRGGSGMDDSQMVRLAGHIAEAVARAMSGMSVRVEGGGFADAVVGAIVDGTRRGRLSPNVNEAYERS